MSEYISLCRIFFGRVTDGILISCNCEERRKKEEKGKKGKGIIVKITEFISLFMNLKERKEFPLYHSLQKSLHLSLSLSLETWNLKKERDLPEKSDLEQISTSLALQCLFKFAKRRKERPWTNNFFSLSLSLEIQVQVKLWKKATSEQKFPRPFKFVFTRRRGKNDLEQISFRSLFLKSLFLFERGKERGSFSFQIRRFLYDVRVTLALFKLCLSISLSVCSPFVQTGEHDFPLCKPRGYTVIRVFN